MCDPEIQATDRRGCSDRSCGRAGGDPGRSDAAAQRSSGEHRAWRHGDGQRDGVQGRRRRLFDFSAVRRERVRRPFRCDASSLEWCVFTKRPHTRHHPRRALPDHRPLRRGESRGLREAPHLLIRAQLGEPKLPQLALFTPRGRTRVRALLLRPARPRRDGSAPMSPRSRDRR